LYSSCINEENIEKDDVDYFISLINKQFGGWPILEGSKWNQSAFDLYHLLIKLSKFNKFPLFYIQTYNDENNSSSYSIYVRIFSILNFNKKEIF